MSYSHGLSGTRAYNSWKMMRARCGNPLAPNYAYYGGRGITVCERWEDFLNFFEDMGERPAGLSLERIDNDGNYEASNCRWATRNEQQRNSRNAKITAADVAWMRSAPGLSQKEMASVLGISRPQVSLILSGQKWADRPPKVASHA